MRRISVFLVLHVTQTAFTVCSMWTIAMSVAQASLQYRGFSVSCEKNHVLLNHLTAALPGVGSRARCLARCFSVPTCRSINYAAGRKECHLSDSLKETATDEEFTESDEFDYCGPDRGSEWRTSFGTIELVAPSTTTLAATTAPRTTTAATTYPPTTEAEDTTTSAVTTIDAATTAPVTTAATTVKSTTSEPMAPDCNTLAQYGRPSGPYVIYPSAAGLDSLKVYCDISEDGGGWIVIQRRQDGSVDFNQNWATYQAGFGDVESEFWLGNANIQELTSYGTWRLRIELWDWEGETGWAEYDSFSLEGNTYKLILGSFSGNINDSLTYHANQGFSTIDEDNDGGFRRSQTPCAEKYFSGWWFVYCLKSNLNGVYYFTNPVEFNRGLQWDGWKSDYYSMKESVMKIQMV